MPDLKQYVDEAKALGMRVKMYYTLGQMTNHMVELFALKSLRGEILLTPPPPPQTRAEADDPVVGSEGMAGIIANEWLEEHMVDGYTGAWFTLNPGDEEDASVGDDTASREYF